MKICLLTYVLSTTSRGKSNRAAVFRAYFSIKMTSDERMNNTNKMHYERIAYLHFFFYSSCLIFRSPQALLKRSLSTRVLSADQAYI